MTSLIVPPNIELWAINYLRNALKDIDNVQIDIRVPADYNGQYKLITVRNDGGEQDEFKKFTLDLAINVYAANKTTPQECLALANRSYGHLTDFYSLLDCEGSPVLAVNKDDSTVPHLITDNADYAHSYFTVSLSVVGDEVSEF